MTGGGIGGIAPVEGSAVTAMDTSCAYGYNAATGVCNECVNNTDCGPSGGFECTDGQCVRQPCVSDDDCGAASCIDGTCGCTNDDDCSVCTRCDAVTHACLPDPDADGLAFSDCTECQNGVLVQKQAGEPLGECGVCDPSASSNYGFDDLTRDSVCAAKGDYYCDLGTCVPGCYDAACAVRDPSKPYCDSAAGKCVGCDDPERPVWDADLGKCVGCLSDSDCSGDTPYCNDASATCVECLSDLNCGGDKPYCDSGAGKCVGCDDPARPVWDDGAGECVGCLSDSDCSGDKPYCDSDAGKCVGCDDPARPVWDDGAGECVGCLSDSDCSGDKPYCDSDAGKCVGCDDPARPVWDDGAGECVGCLSDSDCSGDKPYCDSDAGKCVGCDDPARPVWDDGAGECVGCLSDSDCSGDKPYCDSDAGKCVGCDDPARPVWDDGAGECVGCLSDSDCSGDTPYCNDASATCVECLSNLNCSGDTPYCNDASATCVECLSNLNCSGDTPYCNDASATCVECLSDLNCAVGVCRDGSCGCVDEGDCNQCQTCTDGECVPWYDGEVCWDGADMDGVGTGVDCGGFCEAGTCQKVQSGRWGCEDCEGGKVVTSSLEAHCPCCGYCDFGTCMYNTSTGYTPPPDGTVCDQGAECGTCTVGVGYNGNGSACGDGEKCVGGACVQCENDDDCGECRTCRGNECMAVVDGVECPCGTCQDGECHSECGSGEICDGTGCVSDPCADVHCPNCYVCADRTCVPRTDCEHGCNRETGECNACANNIDCGESSCLQCTDGQCVTKSCDHGCRYETGECNECSVAGDCAGCADCVEGQCVAKACTYGCNAETHECNACNGAEGCAGCADCVGGQCVDKTCEHDCDPITHACYECSSDSDCGETMPHCFEGRCRECSADVHCGDEDCHRCVNYECAVRAGESCGEHAACSATGNCECEEGYALDESTGKCTADKCYGKTCGICESCDKADGECKVDDDLEGMVVTGECGMCKDGSLTTSDLWCQAGYVCNAETFNCEERECAGDEECGECQVCDTARGKCKAAPDGTAFDDCNTCVGGKKTPANEGQDVGECGVCRSGAIAGERPCAHGCQVCGSDGNCSQVAAGKRMGECGTCDYSSADPKPNNEYCTAANTECSADLVCVCKAGYVKDGDDCVEDKCSDKTCPDHSSCNIRTGECDCEAGYKKDGDECVPDCGPCGSYDKARGECNCSFAGCYKDGSAGKCAEDKCFGKECGCGECNDKATGDCSCTADHCIADGDKSCKCADGYVLLADGTCEKKKTCSICEDYDATSNTCSPKSKGTLVRGDCCVCDGEGYLTPGACTADGHVCDAADCMCKQPQCEGDADCGQCEICNSSKQCEVQEGKRVGCAVCDAEGNAIDKNYNCSEAGNEECKATECVCKAGYKRDENGLCRNVACENDADCCGDDNPGCCATCNSDHECVDSNEKCTGAHEHCSAATCVCDDGYDRDLETGRCLASCPHPCEERNSDGDCAFVDGKTVGECGVCDAFGNVAASTPACKGVHGIHSQCVGTSCECEEGYAKDDRGQCVRKCGDKACGDCEECKDGECQAKPGKGVGACGVCDSDGNVVDTDSWCKSQLGENSHCSSTMCLCDDGYEISKDTGKCVSKTCEGTTCGPCQECDMSGGKPACKPVHDGIVVGCAECKGGKPVGNDDLCGDNERCSGTECVCKRGYVRWQNTCVPSCENVTCGGCSECKDGACVPKNEHCKANEVCKAVNATTGRCECAEGYVPDGDSGCKQPGGCKENEVQTSSGGCECKPRYHTDKDRNCVPDVDCSTTTCTGCQSCYKDFGCQPDNGKCTGVNEACFGTKCDCISGYVRDESGVCVEKKTCPECGVCEKCNEISGKCEPADDNYAGTCGVCQNGVAVADASKCTGCMDCRKLVGGTYDCRPNKSKVVGTCGDCSKGAGVLPVANSELCGDNEKCVAYECECRDGYSKHAPAYDKCERDTCSIYGGYNELCQDCSHFYGIRNKANGTSCGTNKVCYDGDCVCDTGYTRGIDGTCVKKSDASCGCGVRIAGECVCARDNCTSDGHGGCKTIDPCYGVDVGDCGDCDKTSGEVTPNDGKCQSFESCGSGNKCVCDSAKCPYGKVCSGDKCVCDESKGLYDDGNGGCGPEECTDKPVGYCGVCGEYKKLGDGCGCDCSATGCTSDGKGGCMHDACGDKPADYCGCGVKKLSEDGTECECDCSGSSANCIANEDGGCVASKCQDGDKAVDCGPCGACNPSTGRCVCDNDDDGCCTTDTENSSKCMLDKCKCGGAHGYFTCGDCGQCNPKTGECDCADTDCCLADDGTCKSHAGVKCGANAHYDCVLDSCVCNAGYVKDKLTGECIPDKCVDFAARTSSCGGCGTIVYDADGNCKCDCGDNAAVCKPYGDESCVAGVCAEWAESGHCDCGWPYAGKDGKCHCNCGSDKDVCAPSGDACYAPKCTVNGKPKSCGPCGECNKFTGDCNCEFPNCEKDPATGLCREKKKKKKKTDDCGTGYTRNSNGVCVMEPEDEDGPCKGKTCGPCGKPRPSPDGRSCDCNCNDPAVPACHKIANGDCAVEAGFGMPCDETHPCAAGLICVDDVCVECDASDPKACSAYGCAKCKDGRCKDDCVAPLRCRDVGDGKRECVECTENRDCAVGVCDVATHKCVECTKDDTSACKTKCHSCQDGKCHDGCQADETCKDGTCADKACADKEEGEPCGDEANYGCQTCQAGRCSDVCPKGTTCHVEADGPHCEDCSKHECASCEECKIVDHVDYKSYECKSLCDEEKKGKPVLWECRVVEGAGSDDGKACACTGDESCADGWYCVNSDGQCHECASNDHCTDKDKPVCDAKSHKCVKCAYDTDCNVDGATCFQCISNVCTPKDEMCGPKQKCSDKGRCVGCEKDEDCNVDGATCFKCTNPGADGKCEPDDGKCKASPEGDKCSADGYCGCNDDSNCDGDLVCNTDTHECVECMSNSNCDDDLVCNVETHKCVQCVVPSDCDALYAYGGEGCMTCNTGTNVCETMCTDAAKPHCSEDGTTCVRCVGDAHCSDVSACAECRGHDCLDCPDGGVCLSSGTCGTCDDSHPCSSKCETCQGGECVEKTCKSGMCRPDDGECVACLSNGDCGSGVCVDGECKKCSASGGGGCDTKACQTCQGGECVDRCAASGQVCDGNGSCMKPSECDPSRHTGCPVCAECNALGRCISKCSVPGAACTESGCSPCRYHSECSSGFGCFDNECKAAECLAGMVGEAAGCAPCESCVDGVCQPSQCTNGCSDDGVTCKCENEPKKKKCGLCGAWDSTACQCMCDGYFNGYPCMAVSDTRCGLDAGGRVGSYWDDGRGGWDQPVVGFA